MAAGAVAAPLSPGAESREKERVTLLLQINGILLAEAMKLQSSQAAEKPKETADGAPKPPNPAAKEYFEYVP